ncbi:MAG: hypothetical protein M1368_05380 [Thaumarchaeota archaeon]|nr:hypothetical protein [Nitrososphaerota archaeon]
MSSISHVLGSQGGRANQFLVGCLRRSAVRLLLPSEEEQTRQSKGTRAFKNRYHKRNNSESINSSFKGKYRERLYGRA